jgi:hypothetical protein
VAGEVTRERGMVARDVELRLDRVRGRHGFAGRLRACAANARN